MIIRDESPSGNPGRISLSISRAPTTPPERWLIREPGEFRGNPTLRPRQRDLVRVIEEFAQRRCFCWPSVDNLAARFGTARWRAYNVLRELESLGWIARVKARDHDRRRTHPVIILLRRIDSDLPVFDPAAEGSCVECMVIRPALSWITGRLRGSDTQCDNCKVVAEAPNRPPEIGCKITQDRVKNHTILQIPQLYLKSEELNTTTAQAPNDKLSRGDEPRQTSSSFFAGASIAEPSPEPTPPEALDDVVVELGAIAATIAPEAYAEPSPEPTPPEALDDVVVELVAIAATIAPEAYGAEHAVELRGLLARFPLHWVRDALTEAAGKARRKRLKTLWGFVADKLARFAAARTDRDNPPAPRTIPAPAVPAPAAIPTSPNAIRDALAELVSIEPRTPSIIHAIRQHRNALDLAEKATVSEHP